jgi:flagellar protein FliO/FliZ
MDLFQDILRLLGIILAIALVFFLAWFISRAIAVNGTFNGKGKFFTILERFPVSKDSYILLVKTFDKILLVGMTPGGMTVLDKFESDSVDLDSFKVEKQSFSSIFRDTLDKTVPDGKIKDAIEKLHKQHRNGGDGK